MKPLKEPAFLRLWIAAFFSETAEWMLQIALPVFVFRATGSAATTALSIVLGLLPAVLLSPVAGVTADRWNRRLVLCVVCAGQAFVALPLLFVASGGPVFVIYAVMAGQAGLASLFEPARNALVPELVGPDELTGANGLMSINGSVARLVGGWAGGLLLGFGGLGWVVVAYLGVLAIASALLARPFRRAAAPVAAGPHEPVVKAWLDGLREIGREGRLRVAGFVVVLTSLAQGMFLVLFVVFVLDILDGTEGDVGLLRGVQALGGLVAGFAVATVARKVAPAALLGWGGLALGLLSALIWNLPALTASLGVYIGLFGLVGAPGVLAGSGLLSLVQTAASPERSGRVLSTMFAGMAGFTALGALLAGGLVSVLGNGVLLNVQAGLHTASALIVLGVLASGRLRRDAVLAVPRSE
ncbi:MFS transporter [Amycolatopsis regifaucium]|uniref:MFS transporter n=1 Tax=Amycolatopsis regifaucium TaxID=546365 RepID=A0A154MV23_9PSEU|nr:MFS transporter [Amycolatopsis regifaucium]KZB88122.1 MFS transporter [Amycolatopsis regifaucium]OKA04376.1 MFS transporter [Amycolatopsis regifaucium]SFH47746.1 Predicted arabinose efflux permease, MFS family [Amycolatopsis regifaucium]